MFYERISDFFDAEGDFEENLTSPEQARAMGDDMLYPTYNIFGEWED